MAADEFKASRKDRKAAVERWSDLAWQIINCLEPESVSGRDVANICEMIDRAFKEHVKKIPDPK